MIRKQDILNVNTNGCLVWSGEDEVKCMTISMGGLRDTLCKVCRVQNIFEQFGMIAFIIFNMDIEIANDY